LKNAPRPFCCAAPPPPDEEVEALLGLGLVGAAVEEVEGVRETAGVRVGERRKRQGRGGEEEASAGGEGKERDWGRRGGRG